MILDQKKADATLMFRLFEDHVKKQMKDALRPDLEKILDEAVDSAVASLKVQIETMYQMHTNENLVRIILDDKRGR